MKTLDNLEDSVPTKGPRRTQCGPVECSFCPGEVKPHVGKPQSPTASAGSCQIRFWTASACPGILGAYRFAVQGHKQRGRARERERSPSILSSGRSLSPSQREPHGCRRMTNRQLTEVICPPLGVDTSAQLLRRGADTH